MKYLHKRTLSLIVLTILLALPVVATIASAQTNLEPLFIMSPPSLKQDNFYVTDLFNTQELAPIASTLLVALGENSDTFTVTITPQDKSKSFTYKNSYMLFGFYYAIERDAELCPGKQYLSAAHCGENTHQVKFRFRSSRVDRDQRQQPGSY